MSNPSNTAITSPLHVDAQYQHHEGLRASGWLGTHPAVGVLMILLGCSLFAVLAISVQTHSPMITTDTQIVNYLHDIALHSSPFLLDVMKGGFYLGEHAILVIGGVLALYFLFKRYWPELAMVVIAWLGEGGIWLSLSNYFNRPRPIFAVSVWHLITAPSFPSGHSFSAVMCFGLVAYLLVPKVPSFFWKVVIVIGTVVIILFIGYSRVFVGDHFPTDILSGYGLGIAWSGLVFTSIELIFKRNIQPEEKAIN